MKFFNKSLNTKGAKNMKSRILNVIGKEIDRIPKRYDLILEDLLELYDIYEAEKVTGFRATFVYGFVMGSRAYKNGAYREKRGKGEPFEVKQKKEVEKIEESKIIALHKPHKPKKIKNPRYMICVGENRKPEYIETFAYEDGSTAIYIESRNVENVEMLIKKGKALLKYKIKAGVFERCENGKVF